MSSTYDFPGSAGQSYSDIEQWIEREFAGHGRALRTLREPPIDGEPFMSMEDAKQLLRDGIALFSASLQPATPTAGDRSKILARMSNSLADWEERPQYNADTAAEIILGDLERAGFRLPATGGDAVGEHRADYSPLTTKEIQAPAPGVEELFRNSVGDAVVGDAKVTGALNQIEEAACLIWSELCPGMVMGDSDLPHYENAAKAVLALRADVAGDVQAARTSEPFAWIWRTLPKFSEDAADQEWSLTMTPPDFINPHHHEVEPLYRSVAQPMPDRQQIAKTIYAGWLDADHCAENHFQWFDAGKDNPDSCVHYSNVAKALKVADRVLAIPSTPRECGFCGGPLPCLTHSQGLPPAPTEGK